MRIVNPLNEDNDVITKLRRCITTFSTLIVFCTAVFGADKDEAKKTFFKRPSSVSPPGGERMEDLKAAFAAERIRAERFETPQPVPDGFKRFRREYREFLIRRVEESYRETGTWFLCRAKGHYANGWDECDTAKIFNDLLVFYGMAFEDLPCYSPENHRKAIVFWQSWQNRKDGRFYNPFYQNPQNPVERRNKPGNSPGYKAPNQKYIPVILALLGAKPLHPYVFFGESKKKGAAGEIDFEQVWEHIREKRGNWGGGACCEIAGRIQAGEVQYVPDVEAMFAAWVRMLHPETGMLVDRGNWSDYHTTMRSFKLFIRLTAYMGLENIPELKVQGLVDAMIRHQHEYLATKQRGTWRNMGGYLALAIQYTDYRKDELKQILRRLTYAFEAPDREKLNSADAGYITQSLSTLGAYMGWPETPPERALAARPSYAQGAALNLRYAVGPFGNWVNGIEKRPEEILGHPGYSYEKHGMKPRNKLHWRKQIVRVVPRKPLDLNSGKLELKLDVDPASLQEPYLEARWNGQFEILLNGVKVKAVKYSLEEVGGLQINEKAKATLKPGTNTIEVRRTKPAESDFIELGLIDWMLPEE